MHLHFCLNALTLCPAQRLPPPRKRAADTLLNLPEGVQYTTINTTDNRCYTSVAMLCSAAVLPHYCLRAAPGCTVAYQD